MNNRFKAPAVVFALLLTGFALAQDPVADVEDTDETLKIAALHALMAAPPERALPLVTRVLEADNTHEVKERALFVLSQINRPEAGAQLLKVARRGDSELRLEAVRMIGISGNPETLAELEVLYASGDEDLRASVLEAYLIAGDKDTVFRIAQNAGDADEFEAAVHMLGTMGAIAELRSLSQSNGFTEEIIEALGIAGGDDVNATLLEIYRSADTEDIREAALEGMLISGYDEGVIELYRASDDVEEKRQLLETLSMMGSDGLMEIIDEALSSGQ